MKVDQSPNLSESGMDTYTLGGAGNTSLLSPDMSPGVCNKYKKHHIVTQNTIMSYSSPGNNSFMKLQMIVPETPDPLVEPSRESNPSDINTECDLDSTGNEIVEVKDMAIGVYEEDEESF